MNLNTFRKKTAYNAEKENKKNNYIYLNKNYCKSHQTVIAGDSITEIFNMELFDSYIKSSSMLVYNRGISGDTSDRFLERFDDTVLSLKPCNLVLLIGTNDLTLISDTDYVFGNIENVIIKAKNTCPETKIILQSVYPVDYKNKKKNKKIVKLNAKLKEMTAKYDITYLDMHSLLLDADGGLNKKYTYDGLHPNALGFELAAKEIISLLS